MPENKTFAESLKKLNFDIAELVAERHAVAIADLHKLLIDALVSNGTLMASDRASFIESLKETALSISAPEQQGFADAYNLLVQRLEKSYSTE